MHIFSSPLALFVAGMHDILHGEQDKVRVLARKLLPNGA